MHWSLATTRKSSPTRSCILFAICTSVARVLFFCHCCSWWLPSLLYAWNQQKLARIQERQTHFAVTQDWLESHTLYIWQHLIGGLLVHRSGSNSMWLGRLTTFTQEVAFVCCCCVRERERLWLQIAIEAVNKIKSVPAKAKFFMRVIARHQTCGVQVFFFHVPFIRVVVAVDLGYNKLLNISLLSSLS